MKIPAPDVRLLVRYWLVVVALAALAVGLMVTLAPRAHAGCEVWNGDQSTPVMCGDNYPYGIDQYPYYGPEFPYPYVPPPYPGPGVSLLP